MSRLDNLLHKCPFFYGWAIVGCLMAANFSRQGAAVATLSVFVVPMSQAFGWSMTEFSGAVSLGGVLGALVSPKVGVLVDRGGVKKVLTIGTLLIGVSLLALSQTSSLIWFYIAFCLGRMIFAGPFEIAITSAVANWFIQLRGRAMGFAALAHSIGLTVLPILAFFAISQWDWRVGWIAIAILVLLVGVVPNVFFMIQRPEDVGLSPYTKSGRTSEISRETQRKAVHPEPSFTRREASRTRAFWMLIAFSLFIYPVQAGVSLHQVPHLFDRGISLGIAATAVSIFSFSAAIGGLIFGQLETRFGVHQSLAAGAWLMALGTATMLMVFDVWTAFLSAVIFGAGIGGLMTLFPVAWANNFGRENLGAIRGVTIPIQTLAQASGPLISGILFDLSDGYDLSLALFTILAGVAGLLAFLVAKPPKKDRFI